MRRGTFQFEVTADGNLTNSAQNVETLRRLWLDRILVQGFYLGPGDADDFDCGSWHVGCHLAGAGGAMQSKDSRLLWLEISFNPATDDYFASVTAKSSNGIQTCRLDSAGLKSHVSHHKFMVLVRAGIPCAVWTGSTNMSLNGIYALFLAHPGMRSRSPILIHKVKSLWHCASGTRDSRLLSPVGMSGSGLPTGSALGSAPPDESGRPAKRALFDVKPAILSMSRLDTSLTRNKVSLWN